MDFSGKSAFVMGGTTGIGRAAAELLAERGAMVTAFGAPGSADGADPRLDVLPARLKAIVGDGSDADQVGVAIEQAAHHGGGLDILVCSAAIHPYGTAVETDHATWARVMAVNVGSAYLTAHFGIPHLRKRGGGSIVNVASNQGSANSAGLSAYATSKGALLAFTRTLAVDFGRYGIRANSVSPGPIDTPLLRVAANKIDDGRSLEEIYADWGQNLPIRRVGRAEEMAEVIAFLASDRASYVTGADFVADGGLLAQLGF
ncbi:SDR family NAD(P)-dependent oxidoreductase [Devosia sp.]|uniref:SDR family NAD(P)-dependent oxidoreductase n=1 Tax=Devosia sp. TaxID=1871048 RepID=UPI001B08E649|nr:SDR family oxidoreductase [Devosia sp.]MBO9590906.1 SDR family oxidoreductase [Devosia sp.]